MVRGIEKFKEYFQEYANQYVLIGGTACDISFSQHSGDFRATRDLDVVLIVEALTPAFGERFWQFIHDGGYQNRAKSSGQPTITSVKSCSDTCYIVRNWLVTPSIKTLIYEESVFCHSWPLEYWRSDCTIDYSPPWLKEVRLPLGDGCYYILGGNPKPSIETNPHRGVSVFFLEYGGYTAYVYSPEDKLIATLSKETTGLNIYASDNISVYKLGSDKYLICIREAGLFIAQNGELTSLDVKSYNWRLCPLKNIKSWKVQEG